MANSESEIGFTCFFDLPFLASLLFFYLLMMLMPLPFGGCTRLAALFVGELIIDLFGLVDLVDLVALLLSSGELLDFFAF